MAKISKISWTDGTLNFWEGCTRMSAGCANCYAEERDNRYHAGSHWGKGAPRKKSMSALKDCARLSKNAADGKFVRCSGCGVRRWRSDTCCGVETATLIRPTMFVMSLGDFGDSEVDDEWRAEALVAMMVNDGLDYMILTKRPEALRDLWAKASLKMTPAMRERVLSWLDGADVPKHIAIGATVENGKVAEPRLHALADFPAARRFISGEPLIGGGWSRLLDGYPMGTFHLVIAGGESGSQARPMHPQWARDLELACDRNLIPYHFKQWGEWVPATIVEPDWNRPTTGNFLIVFPDGTVQPMPEGEPLEAVDGVLMHRAGKKASGWSCDATHRTRTERLAYPMHPWKEEWFKADLPQGPRFFPGIVPAKEWLAANPSHTADIVMSAHPVG